MFTAYIAPKGYAQELSAELGKGNDIIEIREQLILVKGSPQKVTWAQNIWLNPEYIEFSSINDAAKKLKEIHGTWHLHSVKHHRRASLIQEKLPHIKVKPHVFGTALPNSKIGAWTLWDNNLLLASTRTSSPFPDGQFVFMENKTEPPGRAYLKLWEIFTLIKKQPKAHDLCIDLGSAPGSWTWVLAKLQASVFSIDKALLAPHISQMPNVQYCQGSGFELDPRHLGKIDWLFSDMICYPKRLLTLVTRWIELGQCQNFVCTIKLQAETDYEIIRQFANIKNSRLYHLSNNKHELTWVLLNNISK